MSKLRVALIGTGFGTRVHLPAIARLDDVEVVVVCSARRERAREAADRWAIPAYTDDYRDTLAMGEVDLVDIVTPPDSHLDIALAAFDAGKHVLCEKPLSVDVAGAKAMTEGARASGLVHAVNHEQRYLPVRRHVRQLVDDGFVGAPRFVVCSIHVDHGTNPSMEPYYWGWLSEAAKGGGALGALFSHHIDLLRYTLGDIRGVVGRVATLVPERPVLGFEYRDGDPIGQDTPTFGTRPVETEDTAVLTAEIGDSAVLTVTGSWSLHHPTGVRLEIYGDAGTLLLLPDGRLLGARANEAEPSELRSPFELPPVGEDHYLVPALAALIADVKGAIDRTAGDRVFATFDDGFRLQEVMDTVLAGARTNPRGHVPAREVD